MKRISLPAALMVLALGVFAPSALAVPAATSGSVKPSIDAKALVTTESTTIETTYDASEYYGEVTCIVKHVVNKRYPEGRDVETCEATNGGKLVHMVAGKGQTEFENTSGGFTTGWDSDFNGKETHDFTYTVSKNLKKFKIIAVY
jgi:hypothetical protein